ncbi:MAG: ribonuclease P protein component [Actinobacteria bacterium]|nr:ribonuclease P protein component [Actinomycetota bacterium]MBI3687367.1 ribonuclease P protein component [Actinomycetota bacterium]
MLPPAARMRRGGDFSLTVRRGRRAGRGAVVVHYLGPVAAEDARDVPPARIGFVVSRAVGGSVVRHRILRQLRHLARDRLPALPAGAQLVVRVKPGAIDRGAAELGHDLDLALGRVVGGERAGRKQ